MEIAKHLILANGAIVSFARAVQLNRSNNAVPGRVTLSDAKAVYMESSKSAVRVTLSRVETAQVLDVASNAKNTFVVRAAVSKNTAVFTAKKHSVPLARPHV